MGQRLIRVDYEILEAALCLPPTTKVVAVAMDTSLGFDRNQLVLKVEDPAFSPVKTNQTIPYVSPIIRTERIDLPPKFDRWSGL